MKPAVAGLVLLVSSLSLPALAGVEIETRTRSLGGSGGKSHYTIWVDGDRLVAEPRKANAPPARRRIVYRADRDLMWFIDTKRATYYQLDPASAATTASQVSNLKKDLATALEGLDPEIRGKAEQLLGKLETGEVDPREEVSLRERGESGRYAEIPCARYDVLAREKRMAEICVADWAASGSAAAARPLVPALSKFLRASLEPLARELPVVEPLLAWTALEDSPGLPLQTRSYSDDEPDSETLVKAIREVEVDASRFELPEGYARSWVPPF
jgi:hypothetical protein